MTLAERIGIDMTQAMKAKGAARLSALRLIKTALRLRETELTGPISDAEAVRVLQRLLNQRRDAAEQFRAGGRFDRAEQEEAEGRLIESYLPSAPTEQEMREVVQKAIQASGASSPKDMGAVMKAARAELEGRPIDGKVLSDLVKAMLSGEG